VNELRAHLADYVELRRSMGFVLKEANWLLSSFVAYLESRGAEHITTELAVAWAISPAAVLAVTRHQRLGAVRRFANTPATSTSGPRCRRPIFFPAPTSGSHLIFTPTRRSTG